MGGFFGAISKRDVVLDVFFGTDYHSHLGTRRGGMAVYDGDGTGFHRQIHNIENPPSARSSRRTWPGSGAAPASAASATRTPSPC